MNHYDEYGHCLTCGHLDCTCDKKRTSPRQYGIKPPNSMKANGLKGLLEAELKTAYRMVELMRPETEEQWIGTVLPNLHIAIYNLLNPKN